MAHWASEIPDTGTKGITSVAPIRGCTPRCTVRSMSSAARPAGAHGRLHYRQRAPGNGHHRTIVVAIHRPVEQGDAIHAHGVHDGMHFLKIAALGEVGHALDDGLVHKTPSLAARLFPPGIANRKLHARIHARIGISHAGVRNMHRIRGNGDRLLWLDEVMDAQTELWGVVENTGPQMIGHGVRPDGWKFVIGPDETTRTLNPGQKVMAATEVPAQNGRRDADPGISAASGKQVAATSTGRRAARNSWRADTSGCMPAIAA